jgi:hypothetical protein
VLNYDLGKIDVGFNNMPYSAYYFKLSASPSMPTPGSSRQKNICNLRNSKQDPEANI